LSSVFSGEGAKLNLFQPEEEPFFKAL
jgi:hypothetical protein